MKRLRLLYLAVVAALVAYILYDVIVSGRGMPPNYPFTKAVFVLVVAVALPLLARLFKHGNRR